MSLGQFTKQLAKEALGNQMKDVMDSISPAEPSPDNIAAAIMAQVQAMQNALKEDQELVATCTAAGETLRVLELFAPSPKVIVVTGLDRERVLTRAISPVDALQLVCKPFAVKPGSKPTRIRFITPRAKPE